MVRQPLSFAIFSIAKLPKKEQVVALQQNGSAQIKQLLQYACDPRIKFLLPEGDTPYKSYDQSDGVGMLPSELRRLYLFIDGGNPNLKQTRREQLWIDLLQVVDPDDAKLLNLIKDKKLPEGLTADTVKKAFPDLF